MNVDVKERLFYQVIISHRVEVDLFGLSKSFNVFVRAVFLRSVSSHIL